MPPHRESATPSQLHFGGRDSLQQFVKYLLKTYLCTRYIEPLTEHEGAWGCPGLRLCLRRGKSRLPWSSASSMGAALVRRNAMGAASPQGIRPPLAPALTMAAPDLHTSLAFTRCMERTFTAIGVALQMLYSSTATCS